MMKFIIKYFFIVFFMFTSSSYCLDDVEIENFNETIAEAQKQISELESGKTEESKIIDQAIEQVKEATDFVQESLKQNNTDDAIKALEFVERSLSDIENFVPSEFSSDMSNIDTSVFSKNEMSLITSLTGDMKKNKEEKLSDLVDSMLELNEKGLATLDISKSLNNLGISTVKIDIDIDKKKEMETWTKEEWADSYQGSVLTSSGEEVITDKEIKVKVKELENKLTVNNQNILEKTTSLNELKSKIDPLNTQIANLKSQKDNLYVQYNQELLKQSNLLEVNDITESKKITDNLNKEIENLTKSLNQKEQNVLNFNNQIKELDLELNTNINLATNLTSQINSLNSELLDSKGLISKREVQLEQLKKTRSNLDNEIKSLNNEIKSASVERDFIETKFERSIDKEVEAFRYYASSLSDYELGTPEYIREAQFSLREVSVITDNDPKAQRIFDLQKYGIEAGLSKEYIEKGIQSIKNDDWDAQKNIYRDLIDGMAKNPNWSVPKYTDAEYNVFVLEDKAIQEAVQIANEGAATRLQVDKIINEKTSQFKDLAGLNTLSLKSAVIAPYMKEYSFYNTELNKVLSKNVNYKNNELKLNELQKQLDDLRNNPSKFTRSFEQERQSILETVRAQENELNRLRNLPSAQKYQRNNWDKIMNLNLSVHNLKNQANSLTSSRAIYTEQSKLIIERSKIQGNLNSTRWETERNVRNNLVKSVEEAKLKVEQITKEEIAKAPNYNYKEKIDAIIDDVPTWGEEEKNRVAQAISGHSFGSYKGVTDKNRGAAVRAALNGKEDFEAFTEVAKEIAEMDETNPFPGNQYFEKSNIRAAAVLRSKKYDYVNDYQYSYGISNPVDLTTEERSKVEDALKGILAEDNPKLNMLNQKITNLNNQVKLNNQNLTSIPNNISKIETELNSLKSNEKELENQVKDLQKQFESNEIDIVDKSDKLNDLKNKLSPITNEITKLQSQKNELSAKLNEQVSILNDKVISSDKAKADALNLKTQFENQLSTLNAQVDQYQKESVEINNQLSLLDNELEELKVETPEISNKIKNLNEDLVNFVDVKANLALAAAQKNNLDVQDKVIEKVKTLENKSIISIEGSNAFRVVDNSILMDNSGKFKVPKGTLTVKGNVFTAGAVQPELLFSFEKLNAEKEIQARLASLDKDFKAGKISKLEFDNKRQNIESLRNNSSVEFSNLAAKQLSSTGNLKGGSQTFTDSSLGAWVLVNATTGEQMKNPLTGHKGGIVCTGDTCGPNGSFGKQAASFGGMYVLEGLASKTGNVSSACGGGGCKFDVETMRVLGPDGIENNVFNERGEGLFQKAFTSAELNEIETSGMTTLQRQHAIEYATKNNIKFDAKSLVGEESLKTQASALAYAAKNNINVTKVNQIAGSYAKYKTDNFKNVVRSTVSYSGKDFSVNNANDSRELSAGSQAATSAASSSVSSAATEAASSSVSSAATEAASSASTAASEAAQEAATQVAEAAQEAATSVAEAAQEAAQEATQVASSVITGNDVEALSQLANDALGSWVLVDAATGKQMTNPISGHSGSTVCTGSVCGAEGSFGKQAASFGGVYVLERLADPDTGNVAGSCASGDCQFDLGN